MDHLKLVPWSVDLERHHCTQSTVKPLYISLNGQIKVGPMVDRFGEVLPYAAKWSIHGGGQFKEVRISVLWYCMGDCLGPNKAINMEELSICGDNLLESF